MKDNNSGYGQTFRYVVDIINEIPRGLPSVMVSKYEKFYKAIQENAKIIYFV